VSVIRLERDPGSFRDPSGAVFVGADRVFRKVSPFAAEAFRAVRDAGLYRDLVDRGLLLPLTEIDDRPGGPESDGAAHVLEHPRLDLVSYPYEWSFYAHQRAALLHLDVHLAALRAGFTLSDATAYNVQFQGARPVFIDHLSFRPYRAGEIWAGHRQFCMQFLNPLLMHAVVGVQPNSWFRGTLEGIAPEDMARLLPRRSCLSWNLLSHVLMQGWLQRRSTRQGGGGESKRAAPKLPLASMQGMLVGLRRYIARLRPPSGATEWSGYAKANSYGAADAEVKRAFVADMVGAVKPRRLWDLGCNSGDYSALALQSGAHTVVGWDFDHGALDQAFLRAEKENLRFLPLWLDAANPSPSQGWAQRERKGLAERSNADALVALAFIHHIAIGRNVPLAEAVDWLVALAPTGVIEFPERNDAMVARLLSHRDIPFDDYSEPSFMSALARRARIVRTQAIETGTRTLVWYDRRP
jgi:ribosomal protein L11 methylase PrmA